MAKRYTELGEIKRGHEVGLKCANAHIWHACGNCGKERWVQLVGGVPRKELCLMCSIHSAERNKKLSKSLTGRTISSKTKKKISRSKKFNNVKQRLERDIKEYMVLCPALGKPDEQIVVVWAEGYGYKPNGLHHDWIRDLIEKATAGMNVQRNVRKSSFVLYGDPNSHVPTNVLKPIRLTQYVETEAK